MFVTKYLSIATAWASQSNLLADLRSYVKMFFLIRNSLGSSVLKLRTMQIKVPNRFSWEVVVSCTVFSRREVQLSAGELVLWGPNRLIPYRDLVNRIINCDLEKERKKEREKETFRSFLLLGPQQLI